MVHHAGGGDADADVAAALECSLGTFLRLAQNRLRGRAPRAPDGGGATAGGGRLLRAAARETKGRRRRVRERAARAGGAQGAADGVVAQVRRPREARGPPGDLRRPRPRGLGGRIRPQQRQRPRVEGRGQGGHRPDQRPPRQAPVRRHRRHRHDGDQGRRQEDRVQDQAQGPQPGRRSPPLPDRRGLRQAQAGLSYPPPERRAPSPRPPDDDVRRPPEEPRSRRALALLHADVDVLRHGDEGERSTR